MSRVVRVGVIGLGRSGRDIHGHHLYSIPGKFELVAACDPLEKRRQRAHAEYGCQTFARPQSMLRQRDLDLIVVASPSRQHVSHTLRALRAGFHVLCEKPLARKLAEVTEIERTARRCKRLVTAFHQQRYAPTFLQLRKVLKSGQLGRIVMVKLSANDFTRRWDWQTLRREYGGNLLNTGSHHLDHALRLLDSNRMPEITCVMDRANTFGDAEDHVKILLRRRGYPTIDLEISSCCAFPERRFNVYGTRGGLTADAEREVRWRYYKPAEQRRRLLDVKPIENATGLPQYCREDLSWHEHVWQPPEGPSAITQYYDMLYRSLTCGKPLEVTMEQLRQQAAVIEECHRQCPADRMGAASTP